MTKLYALLVGIDDYRTPELSLRGARNDVGRAAVLLRDRIDPAGLHIVTLLDAQATRAAVIRGFREHLARAGPGDTAVFWYSGHGSTGPLPPGMPFAEESGRCQTLVCHDSRHAGVPDLYDKELAVLAREVLDGGAHLLSVLDCCHAESGMRGDPPPGLRARLAPALREPPAPERMLPEVATSPVVPGAPDPRHVALAACQAFESAYETEFGGARHGAFTAALVQALARPGRNPTYREVMSVARVTVEGRYRLQNPVLEPGGPGGPADRPFLGGLMRPRPSAVTMRHVRGGWEVDLGALHGIAPATGDETRLAVHASAPPQEVRVTAVHPQRCAVEPVGWSPDRNEQYRMVLTRVPLPLVAVVLDGDPGVRDRLHAAVRAVAPGGGPSPHVEVSAAVPGNRPALRVTAGPDHLLRLSSVDGKELTPPVPADGPGIARTVGDLEHVARWLQIRNLRNPGSALRDAVRIEIVPARPGERLLADPARPALTGDPVRLSYRPVDGRLTPPSIFIRLTNNAARRLFCVLLDLTDSHRVHAGLLPGEMIGAHVTAAAAHGRAIRMSLPAGRPAEPGASVTDWFLLLVAEDRFSPDPFDLPRLGEPERSGRRGPVAIGGVLDRLGTTANRRDADIAPDVAADWAVSVVEVVTSVPS